MPSHDYLARCCGDMITDYFSYHHPVPAEELGMCGCGKNEWDVTFQNWTTFNQLRDVKGENDLVDDKGYRRKFKASEDPTLQIEVSGNDRHGIATFSPEQVTYYREKMLREDSPALRKEMLRQRVENIKARGGNAPDTE